MQRAGWGWRLVEDGAHQLDGLTLRKGALAGGHLVHHRAGGIEVTARIDGFAAQLLGRHVGQSPGDSTGDLGEAASYIYLVARAQKYGETEIQNFQALFRGNEEVRWLQITMHYALVVRGGEPVAHLNAEPHDFAFGKRAGGQLFIQRNTRNQLPGEKMQAILAAEGIDRLDIRMIQLSQSQCFLAKLLSGLVIRQEPGRKHFEGDFAVEF